MSKKNEPFTYFTPKTGAKLAVGTAAVVACISAAAHAMNGSSHALTSDPEFRLAPNGVGMTTTYGDGCAYSEVRNLYGTDRILFEYAGEGNADKVIAFCQQNDISAVDYAIFTSNKNAEEILDAVEVKYMMLEPLTVEDYMFVSQASEAGVIFNSDSHLFINGLTIDRENNRLECTYGEAAFAIMSDQEQLYERFNEDYVILSGQSRNLDKDDVHATIVNPCAGRVVLDTDGSKFNITMDGKTLDVLYPDVEKDMDDYIMGE